MNTKNKIRYYISPIYFSLLFNVSFNLHTKNGDYYFDVEAIEYDKNSPINLAHFLKDDNQLPGVYKTDIFLNKKKVATQDISFIQDKQGKLYPVVNNQLLNSWGIDADFIKQKIINQLAADKILVYSQALTGKLGDYVIMVAILPVITDKIIAQRFPEIFMQSIIN